MKTSAFTACLAWLLAAPLCAQDAGANAPSKLPAAAPIVATNAPVKISATEAKGHIDANAIVTGKVAEVNIAERLVRLNFENPYPKQVFTAVIFAAKTNLFPEVAKLKDKTIEVIGKISDYRGRPEVILTNANQLRVVEAVAGEKK
jgi:DNA/RNA endonuclease YhcR with UshA esterase domain